jgi:hypothetical protein
VVLFFERLGLKFYFQKVRLPAFYVSKNIQNPYKIRLFGFVFTSKLLQFAARMWETLW